MGFEEEVLVYGLIGFELLHSRGGDRRDTTLVAGIEEALHWGWNAFLINPRMEFQKSCSRR